MDLFCPVTLIGWIALALYITDNAIAAQSIVRPPTRPPVVYNVAATDD